MQPRTSFLRFAAGAAVLPAAAQSANPVSTAVVASTATAIPGGTGNSPTFTQARASGRLLPSATATWSSGPRAT
jgi:hypothetical protein